MEEDLSYTSPDGLFVCKHNVGRSQIAEEYFRRYNPLGRVASAGTNVNQPGGKVADWDGGAKLIVEAALEDGIDIAGNTRTQLTEELYMGFGQVIIMASPEYHPDYVYIGGNTEYWNVEDPDGLSLEEIRAIREEVRLRVIDLILRCKK